MTILTVLAFLGMVFLTGFLIFMLVGAMASITFFLSLLYNYHTKSYRAWIVKTGKRSMIIDDEIVFADYPNFVLIIKRGLFCNSVGFYQTKDDVLTKDTQLYFSDFCNMSQDLMQTVCLGSRKEFFYLSSKRLKKEIENYILTSNWWGIKNYEWNKNPCQTIGDLVVAKKIKIKLEN